MYSHVISLILATVAVGRCDLYPKPPFLTPPAECQLPPERGRCYAVMVRWFFNSRTGECDTFTYAGCGGNQNNFPDRKSCMQMCARTFRPQEGFQNVDRGAMLTTPVPPTPLPLATNVAHMVPWRGGVPILHRHGPVPPNGRPVLNLGSVPRLQIQPNREGMEHYMPPLNVQVQNQQQQPDMEGQNNQQHQPNTEGSMERITQRHHFGPSPVFPPKENKDAPAPAPPIKMGSPEATTALPQPTTGIPAVTTVEPQANANPKPEHREKTSATTLPSKTTTLPTEFSSFNQDANKDNGEPRDVPVDQRPVMTIEEEAVDGDSTIDSIQLDITEDNVDDEGGDEAEEDEEGINSNPEVEVDVEMENMEDDVIEEEQEEEDGDATGEVPEEEDGDVIKEEQKEDDEEAKEEDSSDPEALQTNQEETEGKKREPKSDMETFPIFIRFRPMFSQPKPPMQNWRRPWKSNYGRPRPMWKPLRRPKRPKRPPPPPKRPGNQAEDPAKEKGITFMQVFFNKPGPSYRERFLPQPSFSQYGLPRMNGFIPPRRQPMMRPRPRFPWNRPQPGHGFLWGRARSPFDAMWNRPRIHSFWFSTSFDSRPHRPLVGEPNLACMQPRDAGVCPYRVVAPRMLWFFNRESGTCEVFFYGGCGGNENKFDSSAECRATCIATSPPPEVFTPAAVGESEAEFTTPSQDEPDVQNEAADIISDVTSEESKINSDVADEDEPDVENVAQPETESDGVQMSRMSLGSDGENLTIMAILCLGGLALLLLVALATMHFYKKFRKQKPKKESIVEAVLRAHLYNDLPKLTFNQKDPITPVHMPSPTQGQVTVSSEI